ncbi:TetR/AcrR family transcriptional regulator [Streptosporangium saharense]|uniref:TetR/AcrR family transcriptional regulator n=1 Tax=Streptosporangium saharense TaxID=1706840 RepID=UPI003327C654
MTSPRKPGRTAEETRERLLDAAAAEFGAKGYAGARTACIAARAGVNQQLISYHFGGKQGMLDELRRRWQEAQATIVPPGASFADTLGAHLDTTLDRPDRPGSWSGRRWATARPPIRRRAGPGAGAAGGGGRDPRAPGNGEIRAGIDPAFALLVAHAIALVPVTMPQFVRDVLGGDPLSPETRKTLRTQLVKLLTDD